MTYNKIPTWYNLSEDIIVLTGAAGKLGRHYANAFLKADAKVALERMIEITESST